MIIRTRFLFIDASLAGAEAATFSREPTQENGSLLNAATGKTSAPKSIKNRIGHNGAILAGSHQYGQHCIGDRSQIFSPNQALNQEK